MTTDNILAPIAALTLPDSSALTERARAALAFIESFEVDSNENFELAADELKAIKAKAIKLEEQRTSITGPINQGLRAINAIFAGPAELLKSAETMLKTKMLGWQREQERVAAEQRRIAEEAAAAERKRLAEEAAAALAAAKEKERQAAAAAAAGDQQAAQLAATEAQRAHAEAQSASTTAQMVVAAAPAVVAPKAKGVSTASKVDFDVTSLRLLLAYIATGKVFEEGDAALAHPELLGLLRVDEVKLRAYVRGLGLACTLPGVRVFETSVMSARAA